MNDLSQATESAAIREMTAADAAAVLAIYRRGIRAGHATFQPEAPRWRDWDAGHLAAPRLVATASGEAIGWAALSPISARPVYRGVAEVSIYIDTDRRRSGTGKRLLQALIAASEAAGIWTLQASIFPENAASLAVHRACGFDLVGRRRHLGLMRYGPFAGRWRDVMLLERRSTAVGRRGPE